MSDGPAYTLDDVKVKESRVVYRGFFQLKQIQLKHKMMKGGWSGLLTRECFVRQPSVAVLPYDPYTDRVVLIEQFRVGAMDQPEGPWQIELVAGMVEKGERAESVAARETMEEAGTETMDLEFICDYLVSAGGSNEKIDLYCGGIDSRNVGGVHGLEEEGEDIWVQVYEREEAWQALNEGYIKNASAIIALQWLQAHYNRLQEKWR